VPTAPFLHSKIRHIYAPTSADKSPQTTGWTGYEIPQFVARKTSFIVYLAHEFFHSDKRIVQFRRYLPVFFPQRDKLRDPLFLGVERFRQPLEIFFVQLHEKTVSSGISQLAAFYGLMAIENMLNLINIEVTFWRLKQLLNAFGHHFWSNI
jgi:hypothetical protein